MDGPRPGFLGAGGEKGDQAEEFVAGVDHPGEAGLVQAESYRNVALLARQGRDLGLDRAEMTTARAFFRRVFEHAFGQALPVAA